ncbi:hypothetical protein [Rhodococcus sp. X156]|uniref:hypothetical protein n=1 Tax=Rhodococcus sp. X156 TaxID=2499145 RepID=UPI000FDA0EC7|nr:hypothetical protein [Rhodococcus sp. X156]
MAPKDALPERHRRAGGAQQRGAATKATAPSSAGPAVPPWNHGERGESVLRFCYVLAVDSFTDIDYEFAETSSR